MKKLYIIITLLTSSFINAQAPIDVLITGECDLLSTTYDFNGLVNGKNDYTHDFSAQGIFQIIHVGFDGTAWILYMDGDFSNPGFINYNVPAGLFPPSTGWELTPDGCADGTMEITQVLANNAFQASRITIFPNPSSAILNIENNTELAKYQIIDISGRIILENETINKIDISGIQSGIYWLKLKDFTTKFIKN